LNLTADECGLFLTGLLERKLPVGGEIKRAILCSVVPLLTSIYAETVKAEFKLAPIVVSSSLPMGIKIAYKHPEQVGADRLANAVAGFELYGGPLVVVDLGTATTFDIISKKGEYLGGAIAPGVETAALDLVRRTAQLPKVVLTPPKRAIGQSTEEALRAGILLGSAGGIDRIIAEIESELGAKVKVVATGGLAQTVAGLSKRIREVNPDLTLEGLRIIAGRVK
jgi:type III pantothenate kinase